MAEVSEAAVAPDPGASQTYFTKLSPGPGLPPEEVAEHQRARIYRAMVEVAGERGYEAATMREIIQLAGVSSRAFYQHFAGKEECFLYAHEAIVRTIGDSILAAQASQRGWRSRLGATVEAFIGGLACEPAAGRILLIEAYAAGSVARDQVRRAEREFEARVAECFEGVEDDFQTPPLLVRAICGGVASAARARLCDGREEELHGLAEALAGWAASLRRRSAVEAMEVDCPNPSAAAAAEPAPVPSSKHAGGVRDQIGDRALILGAVTKLVRTTGYEGLDEPSICLAAGLSRRRLRLQYPSIDACFADAAELRLAEALARAEAASEAEEGAWSRGIQSSLASLCHAVASDEALQRLGFEEVLRPGSRGVNTVIRTVERVSTLLAATAPESGLVDDVLRDASAGAIWGLLADFVSNGCRWDPSRVARALAFLALAPLAVTDLSAPSG